MNGTRTIDRRMASLSIAGAVLAYGATVLMRGGSRFENSEAATSMPMPVENKAQGPQPVVVPAIWVGMPPATLSNLMAVDSFIDDPPGMVDPVGVVTAFRGTAQSQLKSFKLLVAAVIADRRKSTLLPPLIMSLSASATPSLETRMELAVTVRSYIAMHGPSDFGSSEINGLLQLYGSPGQSPSDFQRVLSTILTDLEVGH